MFNLLFIFSIAMIGSKISENKETRKLQNWSYKEKIKKDAGFMLCAVALILFAGLRISYNDTGTYARNFIYYTPSIENFIKDPAAFNILKNPASEWYKVIMRMFTTDKTAYFMPPAIFTQYSYLRFFKKYSVEFNFSVYLFFTLGTFCFTLGAMKQSIAMAVLTYAVEAAESRKWIKYALFVFIAMLFHTYAIVFVIVPFLSRKPWSAFTWLLAIGAVFVFMNIEPILGNVADFTEENGKKIYEEEILGGASSNIFRIMVYAVPPLISFVYRKRLFEDSQPIENIAVHLSMLSFICMLYGITVDANESDRLATYFLCGTIIALPWMLKKIAAGKNGMQLKPIAYIAFFIYFVYKFTIAETFDANYQSILSRYF